jgi:hypothetical protein
VEAVENCVEAKWLAFLEVIFAQHHPEREAEAKTHTHKLRSDFSCVLCVVSMLMLSPLLLLSLRSMLVRQLMLLLLMMTGSRARLKAGGAANTGLRAGRFARGVAQAIFRAYAKRDGCRGGHISG